MRKLALAILLVLLPIIAIEVCMGVNQRWLHPCAGSVTCVAALDDGVLLVGGDHALNGFRFDDLRPVSHIDLPADPRSVQRIAGTTVVFMQEYGLVAIGAQRVERTLLTGPGFDSADQVHGAGSFIACYGSSSGLVAVDVATGRTLRLSADYVYGPLRSFRLRGFQVFATIDPDPEIFVCAGQGDPAVLAHFKKDVWLARDPAVPNALAAETLASARAERDAARGGIQPRPEVPRYSLGRTPNPFDHGPDPESTSVFDRESPGDHIELAFDQSISAGDVLADGGHAYAVVGTHAGELTVLRLGRRAWTRTAIPLFHLTLALVLSVIVRRRWRIWLPGPWPGAGTGLAVTALFVAVVAGECYLIWWRMVDTQHQIPYLALWTIHFALPLGCCYATLTLPILAGHRRAPEFLKVMWSIFLLDVATAGFLL